MTLFASYLDRLGAWWSTMSTIDVVWLSIGLIGQSMFVARWFIQWLASEKAGRMVVPDLFWYASLAGGVMVLAYGLYKPDPVLVLGQFGVLIYARNVYFLWRPKAVGAGETKPASLRE